jgi:CubicO group peptidase (beta-lactamase class C family)
MRLAEAMQRSGNRWRFALQPRLLVASASEWDYSGGGTELLGAMLRKASGKPIGEFAREALFSPLGIKPASSNPRKPDSTSPTSLCVDLPICRPGR